MSLEVKPPICRICLSADSVEKPMSLFEQLESCPLFEHIMSVASVSIEPDDGLPACICVTCLLELQTALGFRSKCEASDRALRSARDENLDNDPVKLEKQELQENTDFVESSASDRALRSSWDQPFDSHPVKVDKEEFTEEPSPEFFEAFSDDELGSEVKIIPNVSNDKSFQCHDCQNFFKTKCKLRVHWKKEHLLKYLLCPTCKRQFKSFLTFNKHKRSPGRYCTMLLNCGMVRVEGEGKARKIQCTECQYNTEHMQYMQQHIVTHTPGVKPYQCNLCPSAYTQRGGLKQHKILTHGEASTTLECEVCGKIFKTRSQLYAHSRSHQETKIACTVCGILLKTKKSLRVHMMRHGGTKTYTCEICAAAFYTSSSLANHRLCHMKTLKFKCNSCEYRSARKISITKHEVGHVRGMPFPCIKCGRFYETMHHLNVHLFKYHSSKRFQCPVCTSMFRTRNSAHRHVKNKHGPQVFQAEAIIDTSINTEDGPKNSANKLIFQNYLKIVRSMKRSKRITMKHESVMADNITDTESNVVKIVRINDKLKDKDKTSRKRKSAKI